MMKAIAEKLKKDPVHTRCSNLTACVEQVKNGGSYVFIDVIILAYAHCSPYNNNLFNKKKCYVRIGFTDYWTRGPPRFR